MQNDERDAEIVRLTLELQRAYRCIVGFHTALRKDERLNRTSVAYHLPTIGAARRFVFQDSLEGADYFEGKHISILHEALAL